MKKTVSVLISVLLAFSLSVNSFASDGTQGYSVFAYVVDDLLYVLHNVLFGTLQQLTLPDDIPSAEEFDGESLPGFYPGTDGKVTGKGWSGGFASGSIIPPSWRYDKDGRQDDGGYCLKRLRVTGGYQRVVTKLYTDQMMNLAVLSAGSDENKNGIDDVLVFISVDGVGITAETCRNIRLSVEGTLKKSGVEKDDILSCSVSATHCHVGLDTQGMNALTLFVNKLNPLTDRVRSLNGEMEENLCLVAGRCAGEAYGKLEKGSLYYYETGKTGGAEDLLGSGVKRKNWFSCFLFEGISGEKTVISNIGAHPTTYDTGLSESLLCTDYPYFTALAMRDMGYNLVFTQSAEATVRQAHIEREEGSEKDLLAERGIEKYRLSREDWNERYGERYTKKHYDEIEPDMERRMKDGYLLADFIIKSTDRSSPVSPALNIRNSYTLLNLDYGLIGWGSTARLLGENVVRAPGSVSGYGITAETDYLEIGNDVAILTAPGELSPALYLGSDESYEGDAKWTGETSWTGEEWQYDTLEKLVRDITGDTDKTVLVFGLTNDAVGYIYPDICCSKSFIAAGIFYKNNAGGRMINSMMLTPGRTCGSAIVEGYTGLVSGVYDNGGK